MWASVSKLFDKNKQRLSKHWLINHNKNKTYLISSYLSTSPYSFTRLWISKPSLCNFQCHLIQPWVVVIRLSQGSKSTISQISHKLLACFPLVSWGAWIQFLFGDNWLVKSNKKTHTRFLRSDFPSLVRVGGFRNSKAVFVSLEGKESEGLKKEEGISERNRGHWRFIFLRNIKPSPFRELKNCTGDFSGVWEDLYEFFKYNICYYNIFKIKN